MKVCFKCGIEKQLTEFYAHPRMADGHVNKCKVCNKEDVKGNYLQNIKDSLYIEKERKRGRQKYFRLYEGTSKAKPNSNAKWAAKFPEKVKATNFSSSLKKPFENAEKHHWSYNEEHYKDVIWLTKKHHLKAHRFIIYDQEQMMYRRYDNNVLLDTKEAHEAFIKNCIEHEED